MWDKEWDEPCIPLCPRPGKTGSTPAPFLIPGHTEPSSARAAENLPLSALGGLAKNPSRAETLLCPLQIVIDNETILILGGCGGPNAVSTLGEQGH